MRRVEEAGKAEVERLRVGLAELRAYYEEEVDRLHRCGVVCALNNNLIRSTRDLKRTWYVLNS